MDLKKFLEHCQGNWFSQRTNYHLNSEKTENSKAEIAIEFLDPEDSRVVQLCKEHQINPQLSIGAIASDWDNAPDWGKPKQQGSCLVVLIPNSDRDQQGKILQTIPKTPTTSNTGSYILGADEALTLIMETKDFVVEERLWFAGDNLRLRTIIIKNSQGKMQTTFYSEIRKLPPKK
ncbi:MAG: phycobiliprotein lyase [Xenococcaceae cyanobacterium MO_167.B27]|nr:phycobiliprotein lyase [Xenococcaceae cyanobacterium MO_167.B27]